MACQVPLRILSDLVVHDHISVALRRSVVPHDPSPRVSEDDHLRGALGRRKLKELHRRQFEEARYSSLSAKPPSCKFKRDSTSQLTVCEQSSNWESMSGNKPSYVDPAEPAS